LSEKWLPVNKDALHSLPLRADLATFDFDSWQLCDQFIGIGIPLGLELACVVFERISLDFDSRCSFLDDDFTGLNARGAKPEHTEAERIAPTNAERTHKAVVPNRAHVQQVESLGKTQRKSSTAIGNGTSDDRATRTLYGNRCAKHWRATATIGHDTDDNLRRRCYRDESN
jgi:hypothetical protein